MTANSRATGATLAQPLVVPRMKMTNAKGSAVSGALVEFRGPYDVGCDPAAVSKQLQVVRRPRTGHLAAWPRGI